MTSFSWTLHQRLFTTAAVSVKVKILNIVELNKNDNTWHWATIIIRIIQYVWDDLSTDNPLECTTKSPLDGNVSLYFNTDQPKLIDFLFSQSQTELYYTLQILDFQNRNLH